MRKKLAFLLLVMIMMMLAGCSDDEEEQENTAGQTENASVTDAVTPLEAPTDVPTEAPTEIPEKKEELNPERYNEAGEMYVEYTEDYYINHSYKGGEIPYDLEKYAPLCPYVGRWYSSDYHSETGAGIYVYSDGYISEVSYAGDISPYVSRCEVNEKGNLVSELSFGKTEYEFKDGQLVDLYGYTYPYADIEFPYEDISSVFHGGWNYEENADSWDVDLTISRWDSSYQFGRYGEGKAGKIITLFPADHIALLDENNDVFETITIDGDGNLILSDGRKMVMAPDDSDDSSLAELYGEHSENEYESDDSSLKEKEKKQTDKKKSDSGDNSDFTGSKADYTDERDDNDCDDDDYNDCDDDDYNDCDDDDYDDCDDDDYDDCDDDDYDDCDDDDYDDDDDDCDDDDRDDDVDDESEAYSSEWIKFCSEYGYDVNDASGYDAKKFIPENIYSEKQYVTSSNEVIEEYPFIGYWKVTEWNGEPDPELSGLIIYTDQAWCWVNEDGKASDDIDYSAYIDYSEASGFDAQNGPVLYLQDEDDYDNPLAVQPVKSEGIVNNRYQHLKDQNGNIYEFQCLPKDFR